MDAEHYIAARQKALKVLLREKRKAAGFSQQAVARALSCARTRIVDIEDTDSSTFYSVGEVELLAVLFGLHPLELLRGSGQDFIDLGQFATEQQTNDALLGSVDCTLPQHVAQWYADTDHAPGSILFSPSGATIATIVDDGESEVWDDSLDGPSPFTLLCWDARAGTLIGERRVPYVEHLAVIDDTRVAIATSRPLLRKVDDVGDGVGDNRLQIWNLRTDTIEREMQLLDEAGNLAVSADGCFLAAYFPVTTTIQCWRTSDWTPAQAFELETSQGDLDSLGSMFRAADEVRKLPRERKLDSWLGHYLATRFEFLDERLLVIGFGKRVSEFDLLSLRGHVPFEIEHPVVPWGPLTHRRNKNREIAVTGLKYDDRFGESRIEMWYLGMGKDRPRPEDTSRQVVRRLPGAVHIPTIVDETSILALVAYDTPYRYHRSYKTRIGLCNVVSGRVVMLSDGGRLHERDHQISAGISPKGDAIAYWGCPLEGPPRLTIQSITDMPLRVKGISVEAGLE